MSFSWLIRRASLVGFALVLVGLFIFVPGSLLAAWQNVDQMLGETDVLTYASPACSLPGDLNADGVVNVRDMQVVADLWQRQQGDSDYRPEYDLNTDGYITIADIQIVSGEWGNNCGVLSPVEVTITPAEGGVLISADNRVRLAIPPLAVDSPVTIRYQQLRNRYVPGYKSTEFFFELTARDAQGQPVTHFDRYLDLTVGYSEIEGLDESKLILSYTQDNTHWRPLHFTRHTNTNQLSARLEHFTTFAVFGDTYEVGIGDGVPANVTDAFRAAYHRNSSTYTIGEPEGPVHDWNSAWVQDFDGATIVFNANTGTAYYLHHEYSSAYANVHGPGSFLGTSHQ